MWIVVAWFLFFAMRAAHSGPLEDALPAELRPQEEPPPVAAFQPSKSADTAKNLVSADSRPDYVITRDLDGYMFAFSPSCTLNMKFHEKQTCKGACEALRAEFKNLTSRQHWIDVGAGMAIAAMQYVENEPTYLHRFSSNRPARVTAVTVERYENPLLSKTLSRYGPDRFRYLSGRYIEDYSVSELGQADIITDVYGAVAYSPHIDLVLAKFGELLKKEGKVYALIKKMKKHYGYFAVDPDVFTIVGANGEKIPAEEWLGAIKGFTLLPHSKGAETIILQKTSDRVVVPPLELIEYKDDYPPVRKYRWNRSP